MGFGDLKSKNGQEALNDFLADRSYIEGYVPSQADTVVFGALQGVPASGLPHLLRWYNQISSYGRDRESFPGAKRPLESYGPSSGADPAKKKDDEDEIDLFGSDDDDDAETEARKQERVADYEARKSKKPALIAKSNIILDVKPWDDETNMAELEKAVRSITCDGLLWGSSKLVPVGYGIKKLQISCVVEDDKVSTEWLEEEMTKFDDLIQSMDIAAFNKV